MKKQAVNYWLKGRDWYSQVKKLQRPRFVNNPLWQYWVSNREKQLQYLSQSAQLEEAGNPWLVQLTMLTVSVFVLLFFVWSAVAEVNEVTRAPGEVIPDGFQQSVQHLEGGIIENILVAEGDIVEKGQPLLQLSTDSIQADLDRIDAAGIPVDIVFEQGIETLGLQ